MSKGSSRRLSDMGLVRGRSAGPHLHHRHLDLDGCSIATTRAIFAGVSPPQTRSTSSRGTPEVDDHPGQVDLDSWPSTAAPSAGSTA